MPSKVKRADDNEEEEEEEDLFEGEALQNLSRHTKQHAATPCVHTAAAILFMEGVAEAG